MDRYTKAILTALTLVVPIAGFADLREEVEKRCGELEAEHEEINRDLEQYAEVQELVFSEDFESIMDEKRECRKEIEQLLAENKRNKGETFPEIDSRMRLLREELKELDEFASKGLQALLMFVMLSGMTEEMKERKQKILVEWKQLCD